MNKFFHVTNQGNNKMTIFHCKNDYYYYLKLLYEATEIFKIKLFAFCLMPNHIHFLIKGVKEGELSRFMHRITFMYAQYYNQKYNHVGHVWRGRFKSIEIKNEKNFKTVLNYIESNPLKAKLVKKKKDWMYSSYKNLKKLYKYSKEIFIYLRKLQKKCHLDRLEIMFDFSQKQKDEKSEKIRDG